MNNQNAVAAIRVSTAKQGFNGDSPEAQKEQIERFAAARGIAIKEFFIFLESASKELQPMQQAINYCKDPKNDVQLFIVNLLIDSLVGDRFRMTHLSANWRRAVYHWSTFMASSVLKR